MSASPTESTEPAEPAWPAETAETADAAANAALAGEHAAVYAYGVVGARLEGHDRKLAAASLARHEAARNTLSKAISSSNPAGSPTPPEAAYVLPFPVRNRADALRLAALVEDRLAALYLGVVAAPGDARLRTLATSAVQIAATAAAQWRLAAGTSPVTVAFPGR